ncbi:formin-like protein 5 isoform X1 [Iris pallida]|uniref:Formin-like protein 5 isoform X1 n=1 Tax=Iris pallida TaxID=29817 RepID=A0AAX6FML4_IRIPA|nr:formin-like protein 5 isoform X1 [Iris pallida]KAJ6817637.1 formin-like protein 5 isoform X1 [Iris pallida]
MLQTRPPSMPTTTILLPGHATPATLLPWLRPRHHHLSPPLLLQLHGLLLLPTSQTAATTSILFPPPAPPRLAARPSSRPRAPVPSPARQGHAATCALLQQQDDREQQRRKPGCARARWQRCRAAAGVEAAVAMPPPLWAITGDPPGSALFSSSATYRRFVRFARRPVVTRAKSRSFWRSVAATSCEFSGRSDRWIGDFFAPSQSRFAGPTSSACISSTAALFGVLPVPVRSWTLWLQWDLLYLSAVQVIEANSLEVPASLEETQ